VCDSEINGHITTAFPAHQQDVCQAAAVTTGLLLGCGDDRLDEYFKDGFTQGGVPPCAAILVATHNVVTEGVHGLIAEWTAREGASHGQKWEAQPPPEQHAIVHVIDVSAQTAVGLD
jgi:hypothetical protein